MPEVLLGLTEFNKNKSKKDGLNIYCKLCQKITNTESKIKKLKERIKGNIIGTFANGKIIMQV